MLIRFFYMLREGGVPVSLTEFLVLLEALEARVIGLSAANDKYIGHRGHITNQVHIIRVGDF